MAQPALLPTEPAHVAVAIVEQASPVAVEPAPIHAPPAVAEPVHRPHVEAAPEPKPAPAPVPQASPADLERVLSESGLQLVQTKVKVELPPEPEFVPAKRQRRPPPADLGQSLQIVETRKEV